MVKMVTLHTIDMRILEADCHVKALRSAINQITPMTSLPNAVCEKYEELCSYITSCHNLKRQAEETAQRLKDNLKRGLSIDISDIEISPPAVPFISNQQVFHTIGSSAASNNEPNASSGSRSLAPTNSESPALYSNGHLTPSNNSSQGVQQGYPAILEPNAEHQQQQSGQERGNLHQLPLCMDGIFPNYFRSEQATVPDMIACQPWCTVCYPQSS